MHLFYINIFIFNFYEVFYVFRSRGFNLAETAVRTGVARYLLYASVWAVLYLQHAEDIKKLNVKILIYKMWILLAYIVQLLYNYITLQGEKNTKIKIKNFKT